MGSRATGQAAKRREGFDLKGSPALRNVCSHVFPRLYLISLYVLWRVP